MRPSLSPRKLISPQPLGAAAPPRARPAPPAAAGRRDATPAETSGNILEAFFVGRAAAEVVNERLGAAVGEALASFGRADAELRGALRDLQDEVLARARAEMSSATGGGGGALPGGGGGGGSGAGAAPPPAPDVAEAADNLRAEVAAARALLQGVKRQPPGGTR